MSVAMRLGLAGDLIPTNPDELTPERAHELAALGVRRLVTHFRGHPSEFAGARAQRVKAVLADAGLSIAQAAGYNPNLVQPDNARRDTDLDRLRQGLALTRELGSDVLITGCGSHHDTLFYGPDRRNHTPAARDRLVENLTKALPWAEENGVIIALECHQLTTLDTPENIHEVITAVGSPWVKANFDPVNLISSLAQAFDSAATMRHIHEVLRDDLVPMAHIKDIVVGDDAVLTLREGAPGTGELDLPTFFNICREFGDGAMIAVEHLPRDQALATIRYVVETAPQHGIEWIS
jgi:sugar phosphate isomerase/epimerase